MHIPRPTLLLIAASVAILCALLAEAKGFGGYGRASGGGYYRSSKLGYYSRTNRYYVTGMYWRSGYSYGFAGPEFRKGAPPLTSSELASIICKRQVIVDSTNPTNYADSIVYNSTQNCYRENTETPGSPLNQEVETLMLNRFRYQLRADPYPTVDLVVYPDKDIVIGAVNNSLRFHTLHVFQRSANADAATINLGALTWSPCSLDECYSSSTTNPTPHVEFGRPSSRFMEGGRIFYNALRAQYNGDLEITLRFWISSDFNEDPNWDHVFLMPSAVKWDVVVKTLNPLAFPNLQTCPYPGDGSIVTGCYDLFLDAALAAPLSGAGSQAMRNAAPVGKQATEYEPQRMERVQLGDTTDISNGKGSYVSWASSNSRTFLCFDAETDYTCATWVPWTSTDGSKLTTVCTGDTAVDPVYCQGTHFLRPGQIAYGMKWRIGCLNNNTSEDVSWYLNFGFNDPSVGLQADLDGASPVAIAAGLVVALLVVML